MSGSTLILTAQSATRYYFDFEDVIAEVDQYGNIQGSIRNNQGEFQDAVPRYPYVTVAYGNKHSYKSAEFGNYPVGSKFLYHSPSWETPDKEGVSFNHIELALDTALAADTYYRLSFLIANMKSHRFKPAHYGVKFSEEKLVKEARGALLSQPDLYFDFANDDAFVEIQAIISSKVPIKYLYFGMFSEDSVRVPKKFIRLSDKISYSDTATYYQLVQPTRVMLDNMLIEKLDTVKNVFSDIYFRHNEDQVVQQKDITEIIRIAQAMNEFPGTYLLIQGYADQSGTYLYNLDLSSRRAARVKTKLVEQGIDEHRIVTLGKGVFLNEDDSEKEGLGRKVSFLLLKP